MPPLALRHFLLGACLASFWVGPSGSLAMASGIPVSEQWRESLEAIDEDLREEEWQRASKAAKRLSEKMSERSLENTEDAYKTLALVSLCRALAAQGLGDRLNAHWYWWVAHELAPGIHDADLSAYGEVANKVREPMPWPGDEGGAESEETAKVKCKPPPRSRKPDRLRLRGRVVVSAFVNPKGDLTGPNLLGATGGPSEIFAAFEDLREWRCEGTPARPLSPIQATFTYPSLR